MTTNTLHSDEACALLLQRPLISDVSSTAYSVLPNGSVQAHAFFPAPNRPRMGVQANGVGLHCRWMLTDASLIIARPDRSFVAKPRPPGLPYTAGYRNVFSFSTTHSDMIVLSGNVNTYVVCVHASGMDEHALALGVRCFAGHGGNPNAYTLLGQTPRSANGAAGTPIAVSVTDTGFQARHLQAPAPVELESWVAVLPAAQSLLLVGAQRPPPPQMQDYEGLTTPLPADHEAWWVMRSQVAHSVGHSVGQPLAIRNARFVACAGARNQERAFFQIGGTGVTPSAQASLMSLDASGEQSLHQVSGLPERSLVSHIQFDPLVGWLGIAQAQGTEHRGYVLKSRDGVAWSAANVAAAVSA